MSDGRLAGTEATVDKILEFFAGVQGIEVDTSKLKNR